MTFINYAKTAGLFLGIATAGITIFTFAKPYFSCSGHDLTGRWHLQTTVEKVGAEQHADEAGNTSEFEVDLVQDCKQVTGLGIKTRYAGNHTTGSGATVLQFDGARLSRGEFNINFVESWPGSDKLSNGTLKITLEHPLDKLTGTFRVAFAQIQGRAVLTRLQD